MVRLVVLIVLLAGAAWSAHEAGLLPMVRVALPTSTPYQSYVHTLSSSGLAETPLGRAWMQAGTRAVGAASVVSLTRPVQQTMTFAGAAPEAWAYRATLKRGQRVEVIARADAPAPAHVFVNLVTATEREVGGLHALSYEAPRDEEVVVRVQPELLRGGTLDLLIRAAPALRFPVANARARDLQSVFGDPRDAGRRQHEGVDIFAKRGTPVLSATDGVVLRVGESGLGGRVVWVWDPSRGLRFYYAHLHEQRVTTGQRVRRGDVIGTVGNTGNARTTPPHLHFGIYERGRGAIDPYWFIAPQQLTSARASR